MWLLKRLNDGVTKYLISENKSYTVGRKNCDFTLEDDASVSRKHCTIYVAKQNECPFTVTTITGVWLVDERSKYGTYLMHNNDWIKIDASETKKLTSGSIIKFGLMGNIWRLEFKPVVACASGIPTEQRKNIESTLQSINGLLRNAWCKECSLVIVNEITLTVKVVLALINGVPIVTPNYTQKLVEAVKNQAPLPNYEDYRPVIKESILDKALVSLDTKNHRKELFKGKKFVIPTHKQLETLKDVITSAGGSCELFSSSCKQERYAEDNVIVIQLPLNNSGIPEDLYELFNKFNTFLKNKCGKRVVPESEIAQAVAYSSIEKFCNPTSTCFNFKIAEQKQVDLGPVIVEETPISTEDSKNSGHGVVPSSETMESEPALTSVNQSEPPLHRTLDSENGSNTPKPPTERKRIHSPSEVDDDFQKKKARSETISDDNSNHTTGQSMDGDKPNNKTKDSPNKANQTKPSYITNYFQKQNKSSEEKAPPLMRQTSSSFWDVNSSSSKSSKRKISSDSDDSVDNSSANRKKAKLPDGNSTKKSTPTCIETPREVVEVLDGSRSSGDTIPFPSIRKIVVEEEEDDRTGYFGKDVVDEDLQMDELNNTIFSLTIISPAFLKEDGSLIEPPSVPVNVKRFRKQKILSSAILSSLAEKDDELSDGEWIEPHCDRLNISVVEGSD